MADVKTLHETAARVLGAKAGKVLLALDEVTVECAAADYLDVMRTLRDHDELHFELLVDLCGVDYSDYKNEPWQGKRFAVASQLLSVKNNQRIRVRVWAEDDDFPVVDSVTELYNSADWYEREAFDLYGIMFNGHPDLRRILTDYGFVGHPFRKDFPISGYVEMVWPSSGVLKRTTGSRPSGSGGSTLPGSGRQRRSYVAVPSFSAFSRMASSSSLLQ